MINRRQFLTKMGALGLGAVGLSTGGCRMWPHDGFINPCEGPLPSKLKNHPIVQAAWKGIDPTQMWDCHTHLIGVGDSDSGIWVNPNMQSLWHPISYTQFQFYLNASCAKTSDEKSIDRGVVKRLVALNKDFKPSVKFMLLAFDYHHDAQGNKVMEHSAFHTPNEYAHRIAKQFPDRFEWIASIHPYRKDALEKLQWAIDNGAKAVKWLPGAMGIDPSSDKCNEFYAMLRDTNVPLLTHTGDEHAVDVPGGQILGNPLLLRHPLDLGVKVIMAHCASIGEGQDLDKPKAGEPVKNIELFARLMNETQYQGQIFGDISAITQINRDAETIERIVSETSWHDRLIHGSDYPLTGVMPLFSSQNYVNWQHIDEEAAHVLSQIRSYNAFMFDFVLKRHIRVKGNKLADSVFHTRQKFDSVST